MIGKLIQNSTIGGNTFEEKKISGQRVELCRVTQDELYTGLTITSVGVSATLFDLKENDIINISGQKLTLSADENAGSTTLAVDSVELTADLILNDTVEIDNQNLFVQYQRKTEGSIGGMAVTADSIGKLEYKGGVYSFTGVDPNYLKILPRDFMINDDGSNEALEFKDGTNTGLTVGDSSQEMIATVNIPYGTTATEVTIWSSSTARVVEVYEASVSSNGIGSAIGTGTANGTAISITSTAAGTMNYLVILVKVTNTSQRVYGGQVTLTQN